jgi:O-antigen/teichoic acid export membrane protein
MGVVRTESVKGTMASYVGAAIGLFNQIFVYTNLLPVKIVGLIKVLQSFANIFSQLSLFNINGITIRFFPFFRNKEKGHNGYLFFSLIYANIGFLLLLILSLIFKSHIIGYFSEKSPLFTEYFYLAFPISYAIVVFFVFSSYLWSLFRIYFVNMAREVYLRVLTVAIIIIYYLKIIDLTTFLWLFTGTYFIVTIILILYVIRIKQFYIKPDFSLLKGKLVKDLRRFGTWTYFSGISNRVILEIDTLMIGSLIGLKSAGIYGIAKVIGNVISIPQVNITNISNPVVAEAYKNNDHDTIKEVYHKTSLTQILIGGIILILVWFNVDSLYDMMWKEYANGKYVILFIGIAKYFNMLMGNNGGIIQMSKYYVFNLISNLATLIIAIVALNIFIKSYGIVGAAYGFLVAYVFSNIARFTFIFIKFKMTPFRLNTLVAFAILGVVAIIAYFIPEVKLSSFNEKILAVINVSFRSILIISVFTILVIKLKVSKDVNDMFNKTLIRFKLKKK